MAANTDFIKCVNSTSVTCVSVDSGQRSFQRSNSYPMSSQEHNENDINIFKVELGKVQDKLNQASSEIKELTTNLQAQKDLEVDLNNMLQQSSVENTELATKLKEAENDINRLEVDKNRLEEEKNILEKKIELTCCIRRSNDRIKEAQRANKEAQQANKKAQRANKKLSNKVAEYSSTIARLEQKQKQKSVNVPSLGEVDPGADERLKKIHTDFNEHITNSIDIQTCRPRQDQDKVYINEVHSLLSQFTEWLKSTDRCKWDTGRTLLLALANQCYLLCSKSPGVKVCPFCLDNQRIQKSHIWGEAFFFSFKAIHRDRDEEKRYFIDISNYEPMQIHPPQIAVNMLCSACEGLGDEEKLLNLYCFLNAHPFRTLSFSNKDSWFHRTLALIMTRGVLMNCNLLKEKPSVVFPALLDLLKFCLDPSCKPRRQLSVFLLPHIFFYPGKEFQPMLERQLRNPGFTSIHMLEDNESLFFYMQFDYLHVTYPLCDVSECYFEEHSCPNHPCRIDAERIIFPQTKRRAELFPRALLSINNKRAQDVKEYWFNNHNGPEHPYYDTAWIKYAEETKTADRIVGYDSTAMSVVGQDSQSQEHNILDYDEEVDKVERQDVDKIKRQEVFNPSNQYRETCKKLAQEKSMFQKIWMKLATDSEMEDSHKKFGGVITSQKSQLTYDESPIKQDVHPTSDFELTTPVEQSEEPIPPTPNIQTSVNPLTPSQPESQPPNHTCKGDDRDDPENQRDKMVLSTLLNENMERMKLDSHTD